MRWPARWALTAMLAAESWRAGAAEPMADVLVTTQPSTPAAELAADDLVAAALAGGAVDRSWLGPGRGGAARRPDRRGRLAAGTPLSRGHVRWP